MGTNTCRCHLCYSLALSEAYHCHCPLLLLALAPPLSGFVLEHIQLLNISTLPDSVILCHLSATSDTALPLLTLPTHSETLLQPSATNPTQPLGQLLSQFLILPLHLSPEGFQNLITPD